MGLKKDIYTKVDSIFKNHLKIDDVDYVPDINDDRLTFGLNGKRFHSVCFFIDMRGSTKILEKYNANVVIKIHKAFFLTILKIVNLHKGEVRSFNGDSLLAFFVGNDSKVIESAIKAAMQVKYLLLIDENCLKNKIIKKYNTEIDIGIGLDIGTITVAKIGYTGKNNEDLIWIGSNVNRAVRISDKGKYPNNIGITKRLHDNLTNNVKFKNKKKMWQVSSYRYNEANETMYLTSNCLKIN